MPLSSKGIPTLPLDILHLIFEILPAQDDRLAFSSVSRDIRLAFLPRIFSKLSLTSAFKQTLIPLTFKTSDPSLLGVVRYGSLNVSCTYVSQVNSTGLKFLSALPNLESLELCHVPAYDLKGILDQFRHLCGLRQLSLSLEANDKTNPTQGLATLRTLHILWGQCSNPSQFISRPEFPAFMRALIQPSVSTLEHLRIEVAQPNNIARMRFNLTPFTFSMLRTLYFDLSTGDATMVSTLSESMPILDELCLNLNAWDRPNHKEPFIQCFSKLRRLKHLSLIVDTAAEIADLSALHGPLLPHPNMYKLNTTHSLWRHRFQKAHLRRTEHIASKCLALQSISWLQFRRPVGDVQVLTQLILVETTQSREQQVKIIWDPWDVVLYRQTFHKKPLPASVVEMDDAERARVIGDHRSRI